VCYVLAEVGYSLAHILMPTDLARFHILFEFEHFNCMPLIS